MKGKDKKDVLQNIINGARPLFEQMDQIVFFKNTDFTYADCNNRLVEFSRLNDKKRIITKEDYDLPWAEDTEFYRKIDKSILDGDTKKIAMEVRVASGEKITAIQTKKAIKDTDSGQIVGILVTMTEPRNAGLQEFLIKVRRQDEIVYLPALQKTM